MHYFILLIALLSSSQLIKSSHDGNLRKATNITDISKSNEKFEKIKYKKRNLSMVEATPIGGGDGIQALSACARENNILAKKKYLKSLERGGHTMIRLDNDKVAFAEKFEGLIQETETGIIGLEDFVHGKATKPLTLSVNDNAREDLYLEKDYTTTKIFKDGVQKKKRQYYLNIMGRAMGGFRGVGSVAILFDKDQYAINLRFWSDGTATAVVKFFDADGGYLGSLDVDLTVTNEYLFRHNEGKIRGLVFWSTGEKLEWHKIGLVALCVS